MHTIFYILITYSIIQNDIKYVLLDFWSRLL